MSENVHSSVSLNGRTLWLAGLGAAAVVTETGRKLFEGLVERGKPVASKQIEVLDRVGDRTVAVVQDAVKLVRDTVEFEAKSVVRRLDLLTHSDVKALSLRLDALSVRLDEMAAHRPVAPSEALVVEGPVEIVPVETASAEEADAAAKPARARTARAKAN